MKIGILTQPLLNNYGGLLQNYALQQVLKMLGHDPITLDHKSKSFPRWYVLLSRIKENVLHRVFLSNHKKPKYQLTSEEKDVIEANTRHFIDKSINHTQKSIGAIGFKKEVIERGIEGLVVGSDQCWRPRYNNFIIEDMFLHFAESLPIKRRVAYAASFGTDQWEYSDELTAQCSELVKKFDLVTVREASGVELCKKYLGVEANHVLDPTMLLLKSDYESLIEEYGTGESEGNLFNYILDPTPTKLAFVDKIAAVMGLESFQVLPKYNEDHRTKEQVKQEIEKCIYPSPVKWVRAFKDAEMTVVDSFHGMVFSIIFNKPFWVIGNEERGLSRFTSLLGQFGLTDRLITEKNLEDIDLRKPIDWQRVNEIWQTKRKESIQLLESALQ